MDSQYGVASSVALSAYIGIAIACVTVLGIVISLSVYVNRRRKKIERERYQNGYFETQYKPMEYVIRDSSEVPAYRWLTQCKSTPACLRLLMTMLLVMIPEISRWSSRSGGFLLECWCSMAGVEVRNGD